MAATKAKLSPAQTQRLNALPGSTTKLPSKAERERVKQLCNNRLNWTDGGHWNGGGVAPDCFQKTTLRGTWTIEYEFPTDAAAFKWNAEWDKLILRSGHFLTAAITVIVTVKTGGLGGIAVGTLAAMTKDELQAKVPYPKVARGWKYRVIFSHVFQWSPHPWGENSFSQEVAGTTYDYQGKQQWHTVNRVDFDLDSFPEHLAIELASMPAKSIKVVYR